MIDIDRYALDFNEKMALDAMLSSTGISPSLDQLWTLMDKAWFHHACDNLCPDSDRLDSFYGDPVWLLNGMFIEQDSVSMGHRQAITAAVTAFAPKRVVDFGGGFGTLARMMAAAMPETEIAICDPYPPRHGLKSCQAFTNIHYVPELTIQSFDVLVSTDVLEHVPDPLVLLAAMIDAVRLGGHLLIANCFYPVIACHLPCTFHLRYSFNSFCRALGLQVIGPCEGSHATIFRRAQLLEPDWQLLRKMEQRSQRLLPFRDRYSRFLNTWMTRTYLAATKPMYYPKKLLDLFR